MLLSDMQQILESDFPLPLEKLPAAAMLGEQVLLRSLEGEAMMPVILTLPMVEEEEYRLFAFRVGCSWTTGRSIGGTAVLRLSRGRLNRGRGSAE